MNAIQKPMLAHKLTDKKATYPCYVQPKLDGLRAMWNGQVLTSREKEIYSPIVLPTIHAELKALNIGVPLDGEMYLHGRKLQYINSVAAVNRRTIHKDEPLMQLHLFDVMSNQPFSTRAHWLKRLQVRINNLNLTHIKIVETNKVTSAEVAQELYDHYKTIGYEGSMHRDPNAVYGMEHECTNQDNRWNHLLKRKGVDDMLCTITGYNEGVERFSGMLGSFQLITPDGVCFDCGGSYEGSMSDEKRVAYWKNPPELGTQVHILHEELSDKFKPLRAKIKCIYFKTHED